MHKTTKNIQRVGKDFVGKRCDISYNKDIVNFENRRSERWRY